MEGGTLQKKRCSKAEKKMQKWLFSCCCLDFPRIYGKHFSRLVKEGKSLSTTAQWEILSIFGSLQNQDFIQIFCPILTIDFFGAPFWVEFSNFGAKKCVDFS